jgi:Protein of unknown function (DUF3150)
MTAAATPPYVPTPVYPMPPAGGWRSDNLPPLERQRHAVAAAIGEENINIADPQWLKMLRDGVLVKLHIRRKRGECKLDPEDLGLPKAETEELVKSGIISLGQKLLLPKRILDRATAIESSARYCLEQHSFRTLWGYFIPATAYAAWKAENQEWEQKYLALRDEIDRDYDRLVTELLNDYQKQARNSWRYLGALDPDSMTSEERREEQSFVRLFISRIFAKVPTKEAIYESFGFEAVPEMVPLPSLLAEDTAARDRIIAEETAELTRIREESSAQSRITRMREAMEADVIREAKAQKTRVIDGFLKDVVSQLRTLVYEASTDVLASMQKNQGKLLGKSAAQLERLVSEVKKLNFFGDEEMDIAIRRVQAVLDRTPKDRDTVDLARQLRAIATITRDTLLNLDEEPRSARDLGVADTPTEEMVRTARRELEIEAQPMLIGDDLAERQSREL